MMKIFGVGLSKTGTKSLHEAFLILGFSAKHWDYTKNTMRLGASGQVEIDPAKFAPYDAYFDTPVARFYKDLDRSFPGSKFILTERDTDEWLRSYKTFFKAYPPGSQKTPNLRLDLYGTLGHEDEILRRHYEGHNREVKEYFRYRPGDLLCLTIGNGDEWEQLCPFLSVPVPSHPFPRSNTKQGNRLWKLYTRYRKPLGSLIPAPLRRKVAELVLPERRNRRQ